MTISIRDTIADPPKSFEVFKNNSGASLLRGSVVVLDTGTNALDGVNARLAQAATLSLALGIVENTTADQAYGRVQIAGYCDYALVFNDTAQAISIGDLLVPVAAQAYLARTGTGDGKSGFFIALEVVAISTPAVQSTRKIWIRRGAV